MGNKSRGNRGKTRGAFGFQGESMERKRIKPIKIQTLTPPREMQTKIIEKEKTREPKNPIAKFIKRFFFGDGY